MVDSRKPLTGIVDETLAQTTFEVRGGSALAPVRVDRFADGTVRFVGDDKIGDMNSPVEVEFTLLGSAHVDDVVSEQTSRLQQKILELE